LGKRFIVLHLPRRRRMNTSIVTLPYQQGEYRTPPGRGRGLARLFPSLAFYLKYLGIVVGASRQAKSGRYGDKEWAASSLAIIRALESVGVEFELTGLDNLARLQEPCVIAGNHQSTLETMALPGIVLPFSRASFVIKQSLMVYPVFQHVMKATNPIAVSQVDPRGDLKHVMSEGPERIKKGMSVVIFPEGSRMERFEPTNFNSMGVKLALRAGAPIMPLALQTDAWPMGKWVADFGRIRPRRKVRMAFGEPMVVEGRGGDAQQATIEFIASRLRAWEAGA
ncbi:MAG: 1-acyl-sn-glycerol-3-phosphate acyltransferase, partial [Planctomycetales bacterium]|nr:1-acyl-sn-glycerol-3-phosphate acyltransferase [Planctomycetales bacterium]